jgi:hypothetical protein
MRGIKPGSPRADNRQIEISARLRMPVRPQNKGRGDQSGIESATVQHGMVLGRMGAIIKAGACCTKV